MRRFQRLLLVSHGWEPFLSSSVVLGIAREIMRLTIPAISFFPLHKNIIASTESLCLTPWTGRLVSWSAGRSLSGICLEGRHLSRSMSRIPIIYPLNKLSSIRRRNSLLFWYHPIPVQSSSSHLITHTFPGNAQFLANSRREDARRTQFRSRRQGRFHDSGPSVKYSWTDSRVVYVYRGQRGVKHQP